MSRVSCTRAPDPNTDNCLPQVEQHFSSQERPEDRAIPQRVQLLCAAAAFDTALGRGKRDRGARNEIFARAGGLLSQARALDFDNQLPSLGSAQLSLAKVQLPLRPCMQSASPG
jgi:hypothetical protein